MPDRLCLEICVESVERARAAERGGADRIELCSDLSSGGITPSFGFMQTVRRHVRIPIHVLIRPRAGDFCYSEREFEIMHDDIEAAKQCGMNGVVLGVLDARKRIDITRTKSLVDAARPLPVTFHRAFDTCASTERALQDVIETGSSRILTSGGKTLATDALRKLTRLVRSAQDQITIMACGGINYENLVRIVQATAAREIHTSMGASLRAASGNGYQTSRANRRFQPSTQDSPAVLEREVLKLIKLIQSIPRAE
jgi:copper homeostasis protein